MKYDLNGLIGNAAQSLAPRDGGTAFALYELADNLTELLNGKCTLEEFLGCYSADDRPKFIRNGLMPGEKGYNERESAA